MKASKRFLEIMLEDHAKVIPGYVYCDDVKTYGELIRLETIIENPEISVIGYRQYEREYEELCKQLKLINTI